MQNITDFSKNCNKNFLIIGVESGFWSVAETFRLPPWKAKAFRYIERFIVIFLRHQNPVLTLHSVRSGI
jgi:hypothetical protein